MTYRGSGVKITKQYLKQIIKEEIEALLQEKTWYPSWEGAIKAQDPDRMSVALARSLSKTGNLPHSTSWRKAIQRDESGTGTRLPENPQTIYDPNKERWEQSLERSEAEQERAGMEEDLEEKLKPSMGPGEYVKDFRKSEAPQFKGKSKKKKQQMAIAAYLDDKKESA